MDIAKRIEKAWSALLNQKSRNYLLRSKVDQNIAITNSNLSASFLGNRQMANHNTADIKYCLNQIVEKNITDVSAAELNVELIFLKHQQKLNKRLVENSQALMSALEQLQQAHERVMKTNEEIVSFNLKMLEATSEIISSDEMPIPMRLDMNEISTEVEKVEKGCLLSDKRIQKFITQVDEISVKNETLSKELNDKREKILKNRERIASVRADLSVWTQ